MRILLASFVLTVGLLGTTSARAQDYDRATGQSAFTSIVSLGGTALAFSDPDDGSVTVSLPFPVTYFGQSFAAGSALTVSANGFVALGTAVSEYQNAAIPSGSVPNGFIAGFWDDLELGSGGIYQGLFELTSGEQVLITEYADVQIRGQPASRLTFQIWVVEGGQELDIHFGAVGSNVFGSASIGLESPNGALGVAEACSPYCTSLDVGVDRFISFLPRTAPPPMPADLIVTSLSSAPSQAPVGSGFDLQLDAQNQGETAASTFDVVAVLDQNGVFESSDLELGRVTVSGGLAAGASRVLSFRATVPSQASGSYTVRLVADPAGLVPEENRTNNLASAGPLTVEVETTALEIITRTLSPAVVSEAYSFQLEATPGSNPSWSIISGDPGPGLSLSPGGVLAGIPTAAGTAAFRVQAYDLSLGTATWDFVLSVLPPDGFRLVSSPLPRAAVGTPYSARLAARGGTPPYAFLVVSGAPAWFQLRSDGEAAGTPDQVGVHSIEISVADSAGAFAGGTLRLEVVESRPLAISTASLPRGIEGFSYEVQLEAEGGQPPYSWSTVSGALPDGLALAPGGLISGVPQLEQSSSIGFSVVDASGISATRELELVVEALRPLTITMPSRVAVKLGEENALPLLADGGVPPYVFSLVSGQLPEGITISVEADQSYFAGVTTSTSPEMITLAVTDARFETAEAELTVVATVDGSATLPRGGERARRSASGCSAQGVGGEGGGLVLLGLLGVLWRSSRRSFVRRPKRLNEGGGPALRTASDQDRRNPRSGL